MNPLTTLWRSFKIIFILNLLGCAAIYSPRPAEEVPFLERAQTESRDGLRVTTAVLSAEESEEVFGVDLAGKGVQPVWLEIENKTDIPFVFLPIELDPDYFSPNEVAWLNHHTFGDSANKRMDEHFEKYGIEIEFIMPGKKESGFVYSNLDPGIKYVNVTLYGLNRLERFIFYFEVPGVQTDYKTVDFDSLYSEDEVVDYQDEGELRVALENLPCCTTNKDGSGRAGDPLNFVFIGDAEDILSALIRRRWDVTEPKSESFNIDVQKIFSTARYRTFPMSNLYLYGRRQDAGFQKSRQKEGETFRQRNQIRFWLTPLRFKGDAIWVGSATRDMGSDLTKRRFWFAPQEIDPETDDTRDYLVEDLVFSQGVIKLGYVKGVGAAVPDSPHTNLMNQPWWTDGYRAVFLFGDSLKTLEDLEYFPWEFVEN